MGKTSSQPTLNCERQGIGLFHHPASAQHHQPRTLHLNLHQLSPKRSGDFGRTSRHKGPVSSLTHHRNRALSLSRLKRSASALRHPFHSLSNLTPSAQGTRRQKLKLRGLYTMHFNG